MSVLDFISKPINTAVSTVPTGNVSRPASLPSQSITSFVSKPIESVISSHPPVSDTIGPRKDRGLSESELPTAVKFGNAFDKIFPKETAVTPKQQQNNINIKIPFSDRVASIPAPATAGDKMTSGSFNPVISAISNFPSAIAQAIPRFLVTLKEEAQSFGKESTKQLGPLETALYGSSEYKNVNADIQTRVANGDGLLSAYLGGISGKTLDVAFGAQIAAQGFRFLESILSKNDDVSHIEAWKTLGSPKDEVEAAQNYRNLARQFHPDVAKTADTETIKIINQAKKIVDEKGIPSPVSVPEATAKKYFEVIGRETNLGQPILEPNIKPKGEVQAQDINAPRLPGYREMEPNPQAGGINIKPRQEPVGFNEEPNKPANRTETTPVTPAESSVIPASLQPLAEEAKKSGIEPKTVEWLDNITKPRGEAELKLSRPTESMETELASFKPNEPVELYRGKNEAQDTSRPNTGVEHWSYDRKMAAQFGPVESRIFSPHEIFLDTTKLPKALRDKFGGESEVIVKRDDYNKFPIPKDLEPLAAEARKYKTAEEFANTLSAEQKKAIGGRDKLVDFGGKQEKQIDWNKGITDFYNKAAGKDTTNMPAPGESPESKMAVAKAALTKTERKLGVKSVTSTAEKPIENIRHQIEQKKVELDIAKTALEDHPAKSLVRYANNAVGELPEVTGGAKAGKFKKSGDDIATEAGFEDSEQARRSYENYRRQKRKVESIDRDIQDLKQIEKDAKLQKADIDAARKFLDKGAKKTEKEIQEYAKKTMKEKITKMQQRALERREEAHANLRKLEKSLKETYSDLDMETLSLQSMADQGSKVEYSDSPTLSKIMIDTATSVKEKVGILDYLRTPDRVLNKIGLGQNAKEIRTAYENYLAELPQHISLLQEWFDRVLKYDGSDFKVFSYLDGKMKMSDLNPEEQLVAQEIKDYLKDWAYRLNLPEDDQVTHYITHIFEKQLIEKEFDEDFAKIIRDKVPGSVYDPFLEKRLGLKGYVQSARRALEAYMKRAVRKVNMDPALENLKKVSMTESGDPKLELSQYNYVKKYADRVNLRPTDIDNLVDNTIKQVVGYRFGQRPVATITRTLRQLVYRGMLGLNVGSAIRNLTQGVNTYAKLGEKYTLIGYTKLLTQNRSAELVDQGILGNDLIQDKNLTAVKKGLQKIDKGLFILFETAEKINRGAAYWGAKSKAVAEGMSEGAAQEYAKKVVRDTQFQFGQIDTPVALQSDIMKTLSQFGNFTLKQTEMLAEMGKNYKKEWPGILRYILSAVVLVGSVGKILNIKGSDFLPNPLDMFSKFGNPPTLALPKAIWDAVTDKPDFFGHPRDLKTKALDVGSSAMAYVPAGIQAQKAYRGFQSINSGKSAESTGNKIKAAALGKTNLAPAFKANNILKEFGITQKSNSATDILKEYGIK